jgi:hypothetical protein
MISKFASLPIIHTVLISLTMEIKKKENISQKNTIFVLHPQGNGATKEMTASIPNQRRALKKVFMIVIGCSLAANCSNFLC